MFSVLRDLQVREEAGRGSFPTKTITVYNEDPQGVDLYIRRGCIFSLFSSEKEKRKNWKISNPDLLESQFLGRAVSLGRSFWAAPWLKIQTQDLLRSQPHTLFKRAAPGFLHKRFLSASRKVQRHLGWENIVPSTWPELDWSSKMDKERNSDVETRLLKGKTGPQDLALCFLETALRCSFPPGSPQGVLALLWGSVD